MEWVLVEIGLFTASSGLGLDVWCVRVLSAGMEGGFGRDIWCSILEQVVVADVWCCFSFYFLSSSRSSIFFGSTFLFLYQQVEHSSGKAFSFFI